MTRCALLVLSIAIGLMAVIFMLIPGLVVAIGLTDPGHGTARIPALAWRMHRSLSPTYERWARARIASGSAASLDVSNISGTEWPLFGSVFYLQATESLQKAWEADRTLAPVEPARVAAGAIEAATALVLDPGHAHWVKKHWGEGYLHTQNCFYRALLIFAMTSHARLTGSRKHLDLLRDQAETLAREIDESPHGWIEDYPGECYPVDVLGAIVAIHEADAVLGTDRSAFVRRAFRAFEKECLDRSVNLPPYSASVRTGRPSSPSRGCGNSYAIWLCTRVWPEVAQRWMDLYVQHFWQRRWLFDGFREWPSHLPGNDWYADVDSGPVVAGHGFAACAFGLAAARATGRFDLARPLATEALATSWPLPWGTLLTPRLLSNATDAPYLGEAAMLWVLVQQPRPGVPARTGGAVSGYVFVLLGVYLGFGSLLVVRAVRRVRLLWSGRV